MFFMYFHLFAYFFVYFFIFSTQIKQAVNNSLLGIIPWPTAG